MHNFNIDKRILWTGTCNCGDRLLRVVCKHLQWEKVIITYIGIFGDFKATLDCSGGGTDDGDDTVFAADRDVLSLRSPSNAANSSPAHEILSEEPLLTLDVVYDNHLVAVDHAHKGVCGPGDEIVVLPVDIDRGTLAHVTVHLPLTRVYDENESLVLEDALLLVVHDHVDATDSVWTSAIGVSDTSFGRDEETRRIQTPAQLIALQSTDAITTHHR